MGRSSRTVAIAAAAAVAASACGEGRRTSGAPAGSPAGVPTVELALRWSAGSATSPGAVFSDVADAAWSPGGPVAVLERRNRSVALLDTAGRPVDRLGGPGPGPSELMQPTTLGFTGDTLWVVDQGTSSVKLWHPATGFLRTQSLRFPAGEGETRPNEIRSYLGRGLVVAADAPRSTNAIVDRVDTTATHFLVLGSDSVVARLGSVSLTNTKIAVRNEGRRYQGIFGPQPISDEPLFAYGGTRSASVFRIERGVAASGDRDTFIIDRYAQNGRLRWTAEIGYDPVPLPGALRDSLIAVWASHARNSRGVETASAEQARRLAREALFLPGYLPPVRRAVVSPSGRLWIETWTKPSSRTRLLVLTPDGERCAAARLTTELDLLAATDRGLLVGGTEGGVPTVRYFASPTELTC